MAKDQTANKPHKGVYAVPVLALIVGLWAINNTADEMVGRLSQPLPPNGERMSAMEAALLVAKAEAANRNSTVAAADAERSAPAAAREDLPTPDVILAQSE